MKTTAASRVLDLEELQRPEFWEVIDAMQELLRQYPGLYLHPSKEWEYPWALEAAELETGSRVLDAGCGASIFPVYLHRQGYQVEACDIELATDHVVATGIPYAKASLTDLPYEEGRFDAVFCISVIEHLPRAQMEPALWEMHRVLKPGGKLLLTTDFYEDHRAQLEYEGADARFPVDWNFFDRELLERIVLEHPGFGVTKPPDLDVDWAAVKPRMRRFHGYPYTSVGVVLTKRSES